MEIHTAGIDCDVAMDQMLILMAVLVTPLLAELAKGSVVTFGAMMLTRLRFQNAPQFHSARTIRSLCNLAGQ